MKKLDLNAFGVEKMNTIEICSIEGGSFFDYYIGAFQYFIDNFNTNALLIMNDQNGTAIDGYMGSKL